MGRIGGELALAAQGVALGDEGVADRHERAAGVGGADTRGDEEGDDAADDQDEDEDLQRADLGRPVADDLEV